jgi:hypothetical protein
MSEEKMKIILAAAKTIAEQTNSLPEEVIDELTGFCWDEEEAGELIEFYENTSL